jgi:predicted short-subunit dehydrogenase-like oxidoreductase (DUF2520 family)
VAHDPTSGRFRISGPGVRAFAEAAAVLDEAELVILAVPDDALPELAGELRLYSGQALVHTSGALGAEVLAPAMAAGTQVGSFHPLVSFADLERSVAALRGATVAIEGDDDLADLLGRLAESVGAVPVRLAPGTKPAYHAAAVLAAGGFVALLDAIAELGRVVGLDEAASLAVFGRLTEQTLANARALGIRAALTGPMTRGDVGTLERHLETPPRTRPASSRSTGPPPSGRSRWPRDGASSHRRLLPGCALPLHRPPEPLPCRACSTASPPGTRSDPQRGS